MKNQRLEKLLEFYHDDPSDPFIIYGIAIEYMNDNPDKARPFFDELLSRFPDYLPTYYHAAGLYAELDELIKAADIYERGIALAKKKGEQKTLTELENAYLNIKYELD